MSVNGSVPSAHFFSSTRKASILSAVLSSQAICQKKVQRLQASGVLVVELRLVHDAAHGLTRLEVLNVLH